jgi:UPF0755 protein
MKKKIFFLVPLFVVIALTGAFFYFRHQVYYSHGTEIKEINFEIKKGEGNAEIGERLKEKEIISGKYYFYYYIRTNNLINKILPGIYKLSGKMTIPEIVEKITNQEERFVKITFPEGWDMKKMASRIDENGFSGSDFLKLSKDAPKFKAKYKFLEDPKITSLEGYLFPDTYFLPPDASAENIINRMLVNFDGKISDQMISDMQKNGLTLREIIIMASIVEMEVKSYEDRQVVAGIFWKRIGMEKPLQSCATLAYVLGENKKQYTFEDTRVNSPYNTYLNSGLTPGPIGNPGSDSIMASIYPKESDYLYFLSDPETGKTIFSKTIEEHNANKVKYGL